MLYTTIYKFMWKDLGLHGAEKEFFAVIYGFWRRSKTPVEIPIRAVTEITGLSRTSVIMAKRALLKKELVAAQEIRGKPTRYEVLIPDPLENRTGADSERGPVQKSNGYPSGNYTGAEAAPKYTSSSNNKTKDYSYAKYASNESSCISTREEFASADKE